MKSPKKITPGNFAATVSRSFPRTAAVLGRMGPAAADCNFECGVTSKTLKIAWLIVLLCFTSLSSLAADDDSAVRQKLSAAILATGGDQQKLLTELADSGSKTVADVLTAWSHDGVFIYEAAGAKTPILLEEQQDASGKARAIRISNGAVLKDDKGVELRFGNSDLNTADTDMRLRSTIQQTLDMLALAAPDVEARRSAVFKLGNSQKVRYIPILQARLTKET